MNSKPTPIEICDKHLPGRDPSEDEALKPFIRAVTSAVGKEKTNHKKLTSMRTSAGLSRQSERNIAQRRLTDEAEERLIAQLKRLGEKRALLLPADAEELRTDGGGDNHTSERWYVTCVCASGPVHLGGCGLKGDAEARERWFRRLLEQRRAETPAGR